MRKPQAGTALLEMMVALIVMTMIAVMTASSFGFYGRALANADRLAGLTELAQARQTLRRWVEAIPLSRGPLPAPARFDGGPERLRFATLLREGPFWSGDYVEVEIAFGVEDLADALVATAQGVSSDRNQPLVQRIELAAGATEVRFSYYGRLNPTYPFAWHTEWRFADALPDLIRIEGEGRDGPMIPLLLEPGLLDRQEVMSLSSLLPPGRPSRP